MSTREPLGRLLVTPSVLELSICTIKATRKSGPLELVVDESSHADQGLIEITIFAQE